MRLTGRALLGELAVLATVLLYAPHLASAAETGSNAVTGDVEIAVALSPSGEEAPFCRSLLEDIKLAFEEASVSGAGSPITLKTYDDEGTVEGAKRVAGQIVPVCRRCYCRVRRFIRSELTNWPPVFRSTLAPNKNPARIC